MCVNVGVGARLYLNFEEGELGFFEEVWGIFIESFCIRGGGFLTEEISNLYHSEKIFQINQQYPPLPRNCFQKNNLKKKLPVSNEITPKKTSYLPIFIKSGFPYCPGPGLSLAPEKAGLSPRLLKDHFGAFEIVDRLVHRGPAGIVMIA